MNLSQIRQTGKSHLVPRKRVTHDGPWLAELKDREGKTMATGTSKPTGLFLASWCLSSGAELAWWREQGLGIQRSEVSQLQVQRWGLSWRAAWGRRSRETTTHDMAPTGQARAGERKSHRLLWDGTVQFFLTIATVRLSIISSTY